jgi:DNA-directed RNA polymerase III subunit RPC8
LQSRRRSRYKFAPNVFFLQIDKMILVSLGFFDDILIPPSALQHPSKFNETEQAWVWEYDTGDGCKHDLFMDAGETIKFRVTAEFFNETCPTGTLQETQDKAENKVPYSLTVNYENHSHS